MHVCVGSHVCGYSSTVPEVDGIYDVRSAVDPQIHYPLTAATDFLIEYRSMAVANRVLLNA